MIHNNDVITKLYGACFCCFHGKKRGPVRKNCSYLKVTRTEPILLWMITIETHAHACYNNPHTGSRTRTRVNVEMVWLRWLPGSAWNTKISELDCHFRMEWNRHRWFDWIALSSVLRPRQHSTGYGIWENDDLNSNWMSWSFTEPLIIFSVCTSINTRK